MNKSLDIQYNELLNLVALSFDSHWTEKLFKVETGMDLNKVYLYGIPEGDRQHYNCHACRQFINRFGNVAYVNDRGKLVPVMWDFVKKAPIFFKEAISNLYDIVSNGEIIDSFNCGDMYLGTPVTGNWTHLSVRNNYKFARSTQEDFNNVVRYLNKFHEPNVRKVVTLLETETLYRSEKFVEPVKWFHSLYEMRNANLIHRAVASVPESFCHLGASVVGSLLEDIQSGVPLDVAANKFKEKVHPASYQRPVAAPSDSTIEQAEKIVQKLEIESALNRRFLLAEEAQYIWQPRRNRKEKTSVFAEMYGAKKEPAPSSIGPATKITWEKFNRTVLPVAEQIHINFVSINLPFCQYVTTVDEKSNPILAWDNHELRNPVSWYQHVYGVGPVAFNLRPGRHEVLGLTLQPNMWNEQTKYAHHGEGVLFVIKDAKETTRVNLCLFPEVLRGDLHSVRSVIEGFSKTRSIQRPSIEGQYCAGIIFQKGMTASNWYLDVVINGQNVKYNIDRWD